MKYFVYIEGIGKFSSKILEAVQTYGPDDYEGLYEWYLSRGIVISEPFVLSDRNFAYK